MSKVLAGAKIAWNFYSIFKAMRRDALRYRHLREKKRNPELFDSRVDTSMAKGELL